MNRDFTISEENIVDGTINFLRNIEEIITLKMM
jgi:hypothetical protein